VPGGDSGLLLLMRRNDPDGSTKQDLDCDAEKCLEQLTGTHVDFQVGAALAKLECYKLVEKVGERFRTVVLQHGIETMQRICNDRIRA